MKSRQKHGWIKLSASFAIAMTLLTLSSLIAEAGQLPILNWTQRSDWVNVQTAYGATGNGTTDDTAAIQAAFNNAVSGSTIYFPPGNYKVTSTLNLNCSSTKFGVVLIGCGRSTVLQWYGAAGADFIHIDSNSYGRYDGLLLDGRGIAGIGFHHHNAAWFQTSVRHKNLGFYNFTDKGVFSDGAGGTASAETSFENCIFDHCTTAGAAIFWYNEYDYTYAGCDFISCGYGILCNYGNCYVRDCYFENNTLIDVVAGGEHGCSVRRCKSVGAPQFVFAGGGVSPCVVQDCYVTGWTGHGYGTTTGAIAMTAGTPLSVSHCRFVNPQTTAAPIQVTSGICAVILHRNVAPSSPTMVDALPGSIVYNIPSGNFPAKVGSTNGANITTFVNSTVTVPTTVFDAKVNFGAVGDGSADDTVAVQNTINAAKAAGNGAIAYLPQGRYKITSTLNISGSNYVVGGSGYSTSVFWAGAAGGTLVSVSNPYNVRMENMIVGHGDGGGPMNNAVDIDQTATSGTSKMTYDGIYVFGKYANQPDIKGIRLNGLNSACTVVLNMVEGNIRVMNSANANIIANVTYEGVITVDHTSSTRSGLLGFQTRLSTGNTYGVIVRNSNNIVMTDWYQEQNANGISLTGVAGNPTGRVTIQSPNTALESGKLLDINNYRGKVFLGTNQIYTSSNPVRQITQVGTNSVQIVLWGNAFYGTSLSFSGTTATLKSVGNWKVIAGGTPPADNYTATTLSDMTAAFDDLQRLGTQDLALNFPYVPL